jgi:hypothetical protein
MAKNDMFSSVLFRQKQKRVLIRFIKRLSQERTKLLFKKEKLLKLNFLFQLFFKQQNKIHFY